MTIKVEYRNLATDQFIVTMLFNTKEQAEREIQWRHLRAKDGVMYWVRVAETGALIETNDDWLKKPFGK